MRYTVHVVRHVAQKPVWKLVKGEMQPWAQDALAVIGQAPG